MLEYLKAVLIGIVQGITEWLPISSTGHMILLDEFLTLQVSDTFKEMFFVVIQLGSILAVPILFFEKLNPISRKKSSAEKKQTWKLWSKVIVGVLPAGIIGVVLDDWFEENFYHFAVVAAALVIYGIAFLWIERRRDTAKMQIENVHDISYRTALGIGCFQVLSLIPGTSRSGSTILGGMLQRVSRVAAAEFSFFMAIPVMLGASALKILKFFSEGNVLSSQEIVILCIGILVSFAVSWISIRFLMDFVKKHSFASFGWYRIILGLLVLGYFFITR